MHDLLRGAELFSGLTEVDLERVARVLKRHRFAPGARIIEESLAADRCHILLSGTVRVTASLADQEDLYATLNPGDHFGEMSLIDGLAPSATVVAEEESETVSIGRDDLLALIESEPRLAATILISLLRAFCRRLRETDQSLSFTRLMMREKPR